VRIGCVLLYNLFQTVKSLQFMLLRLIFASADRNNRLNPGNNRLFILYSIVFMMVFCSKVHAEN